MNESIQKVLALQELDLEHDRLQAEAAAIPGRIKGIQSDIQGIKSGLDTAKKDLTQLQMSKKQRELDLETQEAAIRKHSAELNAVKTNDAYRALMGEIEKAKQDKSKLEDDILQLLENIDQAHAVWKEKESLSKGQESERLKEIADWQAKKLALEVDAQGKLSLREKAREKLDKALVEIYDRLRANRKGAAAVPIQREQCSGCHMKVSQNLINEVRRAQRLVTCESCSRIVYLEDVVAAKIPDL